jgi:hypothetical protein
MAECNSPQCDWPFCGCDEHANKVIDTMEANGYTIVDTKVLRDAACQLLSSDNPGRKALGRELVKDIETSAHG